jgi:acetolactate synthase-1/2/3 large subunit
MATLPFCDTEMHVTEAIVRALAGANVDTVFGMSGGDTGRIFSRLAHHTELVRTVLVRNEAHATSAAEAYARATGRVGVAMGQGTWIVGQGIVGILEAQASGTPLVLLADLTDGHPYAAHAPYQSGTGSYGNWDARGAFAAVCKRVFVADTPSEAVQAVQFAIKHAVTGQPGPVAVLFASTSLAGSVGPDSRPRLYASQSYLPRRDATAVPSVATVLDALRTAQAPVLLAGGGARLAGAQEVLREVAEASGATVVTTASGKGCFPEDHAQAAGVFGNFGVTLANDALASADTVVVLGSKLGPSDTANEAASLLDPARQRIVQVDVEPLNASWTMPTEDVVVGDVRAVLEAVLTSLREEPVDAATVSDRTAALGRRREDLAGHPTFADVDSTPIHPQRAVAALRAALPAGAVITCDAGENRLFMNRYFTTKPGDTYLQPAGAGGMGYAIPAAVGAKVAHPERTVVAVCGDGGYSMSLPALLVATEEDLPITVVVLDNGILGWVQHSQRSRGELEFKSTLRHFEYAEFARAAGFDTWTVSDPADLQDALSAALRCDRPSCVVVSVSTDQTFVDLRSPHLAAAPSASTTRPAVATSVPAAQA